MYLGAQRIPSTQGHLNFKKEQRNAVISCAPKAGDENICWTVKVTTTVGSLRKFLELFRNQCRNYGACVGYGATTTKSSLTNALHFPVYYSLLKNALWGRISQPSCCQGARPVCLYGYIWEVIIKNVGFFFNFLYIYIILWSLQSLFIRLVSFCARNDHLLDRENVIERGQASKVTEWVSSVRKLSLWGRPCTRS